MKKVSGNFLILTTIFMLTFVNAKTSYLGNVINKQSTFLNQIIPMYTDVDNVRSNIYSSGVTVNLSVKVNTLKSTVATSGTIYLQKKVNGVWITEKSWYASGTGSHTITRSYTGTKGSEYRVKAVLKVGRDNITTYSGSIRL